MAELGGAVINADDEAGRRLLAALPQALAATGYSLSDDAAVPATMRARDLQATAQGQIFTLVSPHGEAQIVTRLLGAHNVSNLLLVAGVLYRLGLPFAQIARELAATDPVDGRLQTVEPLAVQAAGARGPLVVVDYAHTPDAGACAHRAAAVANARSGRLVCLFGCGGDRDPGKRPVMGGIAAELADSVVVSSDNPRHEVPRTSSGRSWPACPLRRMPWSRSTAPAPSCRPSGPARRKTCCCWLARVMKPIRTVAARNCRSTTASGRAGAAAAAGRDGLHRYPPHRCRRTLRGPGRREFDAHDYLDQAEARGACAAVVAHPVAGVKLPQLVLGDTRVALMRIGAAWRARYSLPVVAVTGSNGKTTTKEMISSVLAAWKGEANRLATAGNLNNDIGVPLTLLRLRATHRAAVFELGMNHPGEIAQLAAIAAPSVALVTNAQREHQEFMHTVEAVAHENGAAIAALPDNGVAVYPGDEPYSPSGMRWRARAARCARPAAGPGRLRRADSGGSVLHPLQGSDAGGHGRPGVASGRPA